MLIINHSADYSANNIGRVDLPVELNQIAKAIVDQYASVSLSNAQKIALNTLTQSLNTAGIWSKINLLLMPCLASTVAECYIDVINEDSTIVNLYQTNYDITGFARDSKGIYQSSSFADNAVPAKAAKAFSGTVSMFSCLNCIQSATSKFTLGGIGASDSQLKWYCQQSGTLSGRRGNVGIKHSWVNGNDYSEVATLTIGSELTTDNVYDYINGTKQTIEINGNSSTISASEISAKNISPFVGSVNNSGFMNKGKVSIWGTASGLTDAESKTLCDALTAFQSAFFAA